MKKQKSSKSNKSNKAKPIRATKTTQPSSSFPTEMKDIMTHVFEFLDKGSAYSFSMVCSNFNSIFQTTALWRSKLPPALLHQVFLDYDPIYKEYFDDKKYKEAAEYIARSANSAFDQKIKSFWLELTRMVKQYSDEELLTGSYAILLPEFGNLLNKNKISESAIVFHLYKNQRLLQTQGYKNNSWLHWTTALCLPMVTDFIIRSLPTSGGKLNINTLNSHGFSPLHFAFLINYNLVENHLSRDNFIRIIDVFFKNGINTNFMGSSEMIDLLDEEPVEVDANTNEHNMDLFIVKKFNACYRGLSLLSSNMNI